MIERADIDRLIHQMEELTAEAHVLWKAVDEARTEIVNELRGRYRETIEKPQLCLETVPESVSCAECDATADSLAEALQKGWTRLQADLSGLSWNYLGICGPCSVPNLRDNPQGTLFS